MMVNSKSLVFCVAAALAVTSLAGCRRKKYENPIGKDTMQPDKLLFDQAVRDIERGRYEIARLTLNTLINTYDTSEYLAKAKLAVADSWMREGGSNGLAQAEAEYKDFILFYPTMEEAAEAQEKVCMIHFRQMEKPDRDPRHSYRAEEECRQVLVQFPNSKFAPRVQDMLRRIQEVEAEGEMRVGRFYVGKGSNPAAANRLQGVVDQYPLYSAADEALWLAGGAYGKMGPRLKNQSLASYQRLVKDYPLSPFAELARERLKELEAEIPEADPVAVARMKYEQENRTKNGMMHDFWGIFKKSPDMTQAAKSGSPNMTPVRPGIPVSVPVPVGAGGPGVSDVGGTVLTGPSALDTNPDARQSVQNAQGAAATNSTPADAAQQSLPTNRQPVQQDSKKQKNSKNNKK